MYKVFYTDHARRDLKNIDFHIAQKIIKKIHFFSTQKNPLKFAKQLKNPLLGAYRFRIGDYRAIFDTNKKGNIIMLMILRIKQRKDIYNL